MPDIINPLQTNLPTGKQKTINEELKETVGEHQDLQKRNILNQADAEVDKLGKKVNGDIMAASTSVAGQVAEVQDPLGTAINKPVDIDLSVPTSRDINRNFQEEVQRGFVRGIGQSISSTGDLINFIGAGLPGVTMLEGNLLGNALKSAGENIENDNQSYIPDSLKNENLTWGSLMNPDFWSKKASEMLPTALEFLFVSHGASAAGRAGAKRLASRIGGEALESGGLLGRAIQTTSTTNKLKGLTKIDDIIGTGKGLTGKLIRNVGGKGELTNLGLDAAGFLSAGMTSNLMAGAMNAMELHKSMAAELNEDGSQKYTEDEMADAAAWSVATNAMYMPVDILSWGVTYGGGLKNLRGMLPKSGLINNSAALLRDTGTKFTGAVMPYMTAAGRAASKLAPALGKGIMEGLEETFQETFEEWAKLKGKSKVTGEDVPNYWDFYNSDENRATKILSFAVGGLTGGGANIKSVFNDTAEKMVNYNDRVETLKASINAEDKLGQEAREYHMQNQMFDIINEGKEEFFGDFLSAMVESGQVSEEQGENYQVLFDQVKTDFDKANNLNVLGKEALMRSTIESNFLEGSLQRDIEARGLAEQTIRENASDTDTEQDINGLVEKQNKSFDESINAKLIMLSKARANRLNLLSGKLADPLDIKFVVSKSGKEHFIIEEKIVNPNAEDFSNMEQTGENTVEFNRNSPEDIALSQEQGGIVAGLSEQQVKDYVTMSDDEIYELAASQTKQALKKLKGKAKEIYGSLKEKVLNPLQDAANKIIDNQTKAKIGEATDLDNNTDTGNTEKPTASVAKENNSSADNATAEPTEVKTGEDTEASAELKTESRSSNENAFEKAAIDSDDIIDSSKKTLKQKQTEEDAAAEEEFKRGESKSETEKMPGQWRPKTKTNESANQQSEQDNSTEEGTEQTDNVSDNETNTSPENEVGSGPEGRASIIGRIGRVGGKLLGIAKNKVNTVISAEAAKQAFEQRVSLTNTAQLSIRQYIANRALENNPDLPVGRNELDRYLNSSFAKFTHGPNQIHKMIAINQRFKSMGIEVDVLSASNLFETVGVDAVGYVVANTVFIDEKAWEQPEYLMHEMSHIYYRIMGANDPAIKKVIDAAYTDSKLVERIKNSYYEDLRFTIPTDTGDKYYSLREMGADNITREDVQEMKDSGYAEAPMSEQAIINEELFTNYLQGPLSRQYNSFFTPAKEFGRRTVSKGFWAHIKGKSVQYIQNNRDLLRALNDGKNVPVSEASEFIMKGFVDAIATKKSTLTTKGGAGRAARINKNKEQELRTISDKKLEQQAKFNKQEIVDRLKASQRNRTIDGIKREIQSNENLSEKQKQIALDVAMEELENSFEDATNFDDFEQVKPLQLKGATRILNSFVRSLNYVKRQRRLRNSNQIASEYDDNLLEDREALISEMFNLAYETKGNTGNFISAIENSEIQEVDAFSKYLDKVYPTEKYAILNSMAWVMSNYRTISGVKSYVGSDNTHVIENALSEREKNAVNGHMKHIERLAGTYYQNAKGDPELNADNPFAKFEQSYRTIQQNKGTNEDYLEVVKFLSPYNVRFSNLMKSNNINFKGSPYTVKNLIDNFVKQKVLDQGTNLYIGRARSLVEAITDTNRKYTSYSSVQNAEGNYEPSKIINNHLLTEVDRMNAMLATKPSFKKFKEMFGHVNDASRRKYENPVLKSIYDNYMDGKSIASVTQYFGLKNDNSKMNNLYKNSTDFTQSIEDFMMFNASSIGYLQNMGAFADSPRKFYTQVNKLKYENMFNADGTLKSGGTIQMRNAYDIYSKLNENLKPNERTGLYESFDNFVKGFNKSVQNERAMWNTFGADLSTMPQLSKNFTNGKLNTIGNQKLTEYVFNNAVNGLALSEIFNPGVPVKDIVKRNKGNSSPVNAIGNPNLKFEPIIIADANDKSITDSAMYMLREDADKIIKAGLGVFDLNNGLKLLNYSIDRNNPNFAGRAAYFKGYTTIIDENTLVTEPGLKGIHSLLQERRAKYDQNHFDTYGEYPSDDLLNGLPNYLNVAVPMSAIKSDFLTPAQQAKLEQVTFERLNDASGAETFEGSDMESISKIYDELFYNENGNFMGISGYNFGPQQVMDKITVESTTPVQFISSVIVNGATQGTLAKAEEIQRLIRAEETKAIDDIISQLNNMNPSDYKKFIMENMDLDNMDQSQRLIIENDLNNLNHTAIEDFVLNTLANRLKSAGNKLKTAGTIAQQKSNVGYRLPMINGEQIYVNGSSGLQGYTQRDNGGQNPLEIVLPQHMQDKVRKRQYLTIDDTQSVVKNMNPEQARKYLKAPRTEKLEMLKVLAQKMALSSYGRVENAASYGSNNSDLIGTVENANREPIGYFVKGEVVIATRVPSHGPASTGVFEAVDFLSSEGNQTIVSNEFSKVIGSDYDGDALFIQSKTKGMKSFNKALDLTIELWTSPEFAEQVQTSIDFEKEVGAIVKNNKSAEQRVFPMSPEYNRNAYNNTMVSKRSIGVVFNMHRLANYLAAYNVNIGAPIKINGKEYTGFADGEVGQNSRNNNSAKLANIILDNSKYHFADKLGLNDQTINQFGLLTNMGVSLADLNQIMNSDAVKVWTKYKKNNQSPYLKNKSAAELRTMIKNELGIGNITKTSYLINSEQLGTPQQKANVIAVMEYLEDMNSDVLKLSKIMAGHKGIDNNPFILEKQLKDFNDVVNNNEDNLVFNEAFKNNPDVKGYQENAQKILEVLKKANKIFRPSTEKLLSELDTELAIDGLTERQLQRASTLLKNFVNSRMLGYNNMSEAEKTEVKNRVFDKVFNKINELANVEYENGSGLERSLLFQKALNMYFHTSKQNGAEVIDSNRSYISANPAFFNESLSKEEKDYVMNEFKELPQDLKDDLVVYDLMKNGLSGNLSLVHVFDEGINWQISNLGFYDQMNKNNAIDADVMKQLKEILVSNEVGNPDSSIPAVNYAGSLKGADINAIVKAKNGFVYNKMKQGDEFYFAIRDKGNSTYFHFGGIPKNVLSAIDRTGGNSSTKNALIDERIKSAISGYQPLKGDLALKAISIADTETVPPLKTDRSYRANKDVNHIVEANLEEAEKKNNSPEGRAAKIDYHNYNDVRPLSRVEYDRVMEYNPSVNETQKQVAYEMYQAEKTNANKIAESITPGTLISKTNDQLKSLYKKYGEKDIYAYSVVMTPIIMEFANRAAIEQSNITGRYEDGNDISLVTSWMNNNNIPSNHPATQALTRQLTGSYKTFVQERGKYIKQINKVTDALYKEKFGLSNNRLVAFGQRIFNSLINNRQRVYDSLYGSLVQQEEIKLPNGKSRSEYKFKPKTEVDADYRSGYITQAEYDFYNTFRSITDELAKYGSPENKIRRDYIPHTAMGNFELFSSRGLLGLMVNSKSNDAALGDVKMYFTNTDGKKELLHFSDIKNIFNSEALAKGNSLDAIREYRSYLSNAKKLLKEKKNEDGSVLEFSKMELATAVGMGPMSRFASSRSVSAEQMPSMDLNKSLVDYVHSTLFAHGNGTFEGFTNLMPLVDGVMAYNDKNGYKNSYNYVKEVIKEKFINKKDQNLLGPKSDKIVNGLVKGNLLYALGYKGFLVGKGMYAIGNIAIGKYMNIKREGGKSWLNGELRYWGTDKGFNIDALERRKRAKKILSNLGYMEVDLYDDVTVESKTGLDGIFTSLALLPMSMSENWIQKAQFLGMLTEEEFDKFDNEGNYKDDAIPIDRDRLVTLEERVKNSHGKGYSPTDQSRIQTYSLGRMLMQFSRHLPSQVRERFAKEDVDMHGQQYIGSLRQMYVTASDIFNNKMSPEAFKKYYATLKPHEQEALKAGLRGMAMISVAGFIDAAVPDSTDPTSADNISRGVIGDANTHFDADKLSYKLVPPAMHTITSLFYSGGGGSTAAPIEE